MKLKKILLCDIIYPITMLQPYFNIPDINKFCKNIYLQVDKLCRPKLQRKFVQKFDSGFANKRKLNLFPSSFTKIIIE